MSKVNNSKSAARRVLSYSVLFRRVLLILLIAVTCVIICGCDQSNSDAYGWDDATATPDSGDAMNSGSAPPPRPTPYRPAPTPAPTPTPEATPTQENSANPDPTPTPHVHNWEPYFEETRRKVRRTVEEVIYTCNACGFQTEDQRSADAHANSLHSNVAHIISKGVVWGSHTVTLYRCSCGETFGSEDQWASHNEINGSYGEHWFESYVFADAEKCAGCDTVCSTADEADAHLEANAQCMSYQIITASEPVAQSVYRCSCGDVFYSRSQSERHAMNAGCGNPPYGYTTDRITVEKEVEVVEKKPTDQMVCTVCGEKRDA